jgi:hypothetical protein
MVKTSTHHGGLVAAPPQAAVPVRESCPCSLVESTCLVRNMVESMLPEVMAAMSVKVVGMGLGVKGQDRRSGCRRLICC